MQFDFSAINGIDIGVFTVVVLSTIAGLSRGFVASFLSLLGWMLSFLIIHALYPYIEPLLLKRFSSSFLVFVIGYGGGLLGCLLVFAVVNFVILISLSKVRGGGIDRSMGLVFGVGRGGLLVVFFFFCFTLTVALLHGKRIDDEEIVPGFLQNAQSYSLLKVGQGKFVKMLPDSLYKQIIEIDKGDSEKEEKHEKSSNILAAISKLAAQADPNMLSNVRKMAQDTSGDKSGNDIAKITLRKLLSDYIGRKKGGDVDIKNVIPDEELEQMQKLLDDS